MQTEQNAYLAQVSFVTMGCAKNEVDTEKMQARLLAKGYEIIDDAEQADLVVVNTCSFIQAATEESIDAILEASNMESVVSGAAKLVVAGCMPARYGDELEAELPEVNAFVPCASEGQIVEVVDAALGIERIAGEGRAFRTEPDPKAGSRVFAYVKISEGCDRFCSYCAIPYIRGRYRSFTKDEVFADVANAAAEGAREIVLIAQDTGRWGTDLDEPSSLAQLVGHLAEEWPDVWFRVMYIQPEGVNDELIAVVSSHDNVCSYFDIPFQHVNASILEAMNRKGSAKDFLKLIDRIRCDIPDATLRTTLITGFPGESDDDFDELCAFVEEAELDYVGIFPYSREEGTRAYKLPGQIDEDVKLERTQTLRDLADTVSSGRIASRTGSTMQVLICGCEEDGQLYGRAMCQAPDVDGVTYVSEGNPGDIVEVVIDDTLLYEMEGSVL